MLHWQGSHSVERFIDVSLERARSVKTDPVATAQYLTDISTRLGEEWLREEAYYISALIALADKVIVERERGLLEGMVNSFGIPATKLELITRKLIREADSM
jgi:hypothetical protein